MRRPGVVRSPRISCIREGPSAARRNQNGARRRLRLMDATKKAVVTERTLLIACIVLGAVQAWICRYAMISDGVSYLDIGDAYFRGDWAAAVNAYWSPLYSWCLGLALYLCKPSIWWEFVTVHIVNLIVYAAALFSSFFHSFGLASDHGRLHDRFRGCGSHTRTRLPGSKLQHFSLVFPGADRCGLGHA